MSRSDSHSVTARGCCACAQFAQLALASTSSHIQSDYQGSCSQAVVDWSAARVPLLTEVIEEQKAQDRVVIDELNTTIGIRKIKSQRIKGSF